LVDSNVTVTTYEQAAAIAKELMDDGVDNLDLLLRGWSAGGYGFYPQSGKAAGNLGGKKGLELLNSLAGEKNGLNVLAPRGQQCARLFTRSMPTNWEKKR